MNIGGLMPSKRKKQTKREISDTEAIEQIHALMDSPEEWDSDTTSSISAIVMRTGRYIRDAHEHTDEDDN